ncbi:MAG TPA: CAP domain-containing protein [Solirubrobacteraceae bacterium]|nr:CAP domain-containing protein [Solirubrobacteraceae bacterium]
MSFRAARILTVLTLVAVPALATSVADARHPSTLRAVATQQCADANLHPTAGNLKRIRRAILCLHNKVRAQNDLSPLRENRRLRRAARAHSRDMTAAGYFEHTAPDGTTMVQRILRADYARDDQGWMLGENLAWGTGSLGTPRGAMKAWMASPGHRANILKAGFRELGVGVVARVPSSDAAGATYTVDFGVRR